METYLENVKTKTGKTPDDFRVLAEAKGLTKHGDIINWLKEEFDLGHGHANAVAHVILHADDPKETDDQGIAKHFTGPKAPWRTTYDDLLKKLKAFGPDVRPAPTKTYISLLRGDKKFAIVQVSVKRLDIGIKLAGTAAKRRFEQAGAWNAMVTHRVKIDSPEELDAEVLTWLRQAYDKAE